MTIKKVVRIRPLDGIDEAEERAKYRAAWLARPPEDRVFEVRRLSLALYELAHGPCDPRMDRRAVKISHDAV